MKKTLTVCAIALFGTLLLPSCKKDYTCVCTMELGGTSQTSEHALGKLSKKDAENACSAKASVNGQQYISCKLK